MGILSAIDKSLSFFMLSTRGDTRVEEATKVYEFRRNYSITCYLILPEIIQATHLQSFYNFQIRRKFGLGFLLSFIPSTQAFKARVDYFKATLALDNVILISRRANVKSPTLSLFLCALASRSPTSLLFYFKGFIDKYLGVIVNTKSYIINNRKISIKRLVHRLPIIISFYKKTKTQVFLDIMHTLFNPAKFFSLLLSFCHVSVDRFFEIGAREGSESAWPRVLLKSLSGLIFLPMRIIVATIEAAIDSLGKTIKFICFSPLQFLYQSALQTIKYFDKNLITTDIHTLRGIKAVRKVVKTLNKLEPQSLSALGQTDQSVDEKKNRFVVHRQSYGKVYCSLRKQGYHSTEYVTIDEAKVYQPYYYLDEKKIRHPLNLQFNVPVILTTNSSKKIEEIEKYGSFFKTNKQRFKYCEPLNQQSSEEGISLAEDIRDTFIRIERANPIKNARF